MSILKFLGMNVDTPERATPTAETETVRKIVQKLDQLPEQQARYIAAFAFLLSRAARADLQISADETALMERIVMSKSWHFSTACSPSPQPTKISRVRKTTSSNRLPAS